jgi:hypothetical protein
VTVFRDPDEDDRVWALFNWNLEGWQSFVSDPEVPAVLQEAGHVGRPQVAEFGGTYDAYHHRVERHHRPIHNTQPKEPVMSSPAAKSPGYRKYVLRWDERPAAGTSEYEAIQSRILQVFREWSAPEGFTIHQFVIRVGDWGGYMVFETDNLADIHFLSTALAGFTFQLEPVIDVMDAVAVELLAMEWRATVA